MCIRDRARYDECLKILGCIDLRNDQNIGITGGEPTIEPEKLLKLLSKIAKKSPNQKVHILTNGRNFEDINLVKNLSKIEHLDISYGIPLYSDLAEEHDFITGVKGSFQQMCIRDRDAGLENPYEEAASFATGAI